MINKILTLVVLSVFLNAVELSMFDAGDINSDKPYGLTKAEKAAYENKKRLKELNYKFNKLKYSYDEMNQKVQGISSIYENDNESLSKARRTINNINNSVEATNLSIENLKKLSITNSDGLINLEKRLDDFIATQETNNKTVEESLKKITLLLNKINKDYVTNKQFDELVDFVNGKKINKKNVKKSVKNNTKVKSKTKSISNKEKFNQAVAMVKKNRLTISIPLWNDLLLAKYKPASSNFYMGEVRFGKKQYEKAISHYKTSMMLYDEAAYIPTLLLHSAISFEKTDDIENAINFYSTLIDTYPSTNEAKKAKKLLSKLQ